MNVLILGANGYLGPHVVKALAPHHRLRITDIHPAPAKIRGDYADHEFMDVDITSAEQVLQAAEGMEAIVNLAVIRTDPVLAFRVNMTGCQNVMQAVVAHGIRRVINTGPHFTVAGPTYERFDQGIGPDIPLTPALTLCVDQVTGPPDLPGLHRNPRYLRPKLPLLYSPRHRATKPGAGGVPFIVSWRDAAEAFRLGLAIDLAKLPSRCEVFSSSEIPPRKFLNEKAKRILGFRPQDDVSILWRADR